MLTAAALIDGAIGWAVGRVADGSERKIRERLKNGHARKELVSVIEESIYELQEIVPSLMEEIRSEAFIQNVAVPSVLNFLIDPTIKMDSEVIEEKYIKIFVEPFLRGRSQNEVLVKVFLTDKDSLKGAMIRLLEAIRPRLYASEYWKENIRDQAIEEARDTANIILAVVKNIESSLDKRVNKDAARSDANNVSEVMRSWPKTIADQYIERPELELILNRVREKPYGRTLVIGEAGSGKSALFAEMTLRLQNQGMTVFAIKADKISADVRSLGELSTSLGLHGGILEELELLARSSPLVILIDQLDAVSEIMDRSSDRMRVLLQIANHFKSKKKDDEGGPPVHVIVSSRQFEADYDARFKSLDAEIVHLELPSHEQVDKLLGDIGIDKSAAPEALRETLRRPFALRLFVDMLQRGVKTQGLIASELLKTWLISANFGNSAERDAVFSFLEQLSSDMTANESLWRPADSYEFKFPNAVNLALASGLIVKEEGALGFSHQAWLDDFQAKNFSSGQSLAEYAWQRQDGLFARATILRGLQRLRFLDQAAYVAAIDALLGQERTRRHLRHLVIDVIAGQKQPHPREKAWVDNVIRNDVSLARRALARVQNNWDGWRDCMRPLIPLVMREKDLRWHAVNMLSLELKVDPDFVFRELDRQWSASDFDYAVLNVFSKSQSWSSQISPIVRKILKRNEIDAHIPSSYMKGLEGDAAAELLGMYLDGLNTEKLADVSLHKVKDVAEKFPVSFLAVMLPWFVRLAAIGHNGSPSYIDEYPSSTSLPRLWYSDYTGEGVFTVLRCALLACAKHHPVELLKIVEPFLEVEIDEVQAVIAEGLAVGGPALAEAGYNFLMGDCRRLYLGLEIFSDEENVTQLVQGWISASLVREISSDIDVVRLERLRKYIEDWDSYKDKAWSHQEDAGVRLRRFGWAEEKRLMLLEALPSSLHTPRRLRQIQEWRGRQPVMKKRSRRMMASVVRSAMSAAQMEKASDENIFNLLDVNNDSVRDWRRSGRSPDGGVREVSSEFSAFSRAHSERALSIAEKGFRPGRHETAAGSLLRALAEENSIDGRRLMNLIHRWSQEGFSGGEWRHDVSFAIQKMAENGLLMLDTDFDLIESWITNDSDLAVLQIKRRKELEETNRQMNRGNSERTAAPLVFGSRIGGFRILPHDNFTILSAMASGFLHRNPPDWNAWLAALERHVERSDDPAIWTALLSFRGRFLYRVDQARVAHLLEKIWDKFPETFEDVEVAGLLWRLREAVPESLKDRILQGGLSGGSALTKQAIGELIMAESLVHPDDLERLARREAVLACAESPERLGAFFAAAAAWMERESYVRDGAHPVLMRFVAEVKGNEAVAVAAIVSHRAEWCPDALSQEMLVAISENAAVLDACFKSALTKIVQDLLLYPGFEGLVLKVMNSCAALISSKGGERYRAGYDDDFVSISISLQRSSDLSVRTQAMDLYEMLLDMDVYGAEEAAKSSLSRA